MLGYCLKFQGQNVQRNTFNDIRLENPFISEDSKLQNTVQKSNIFAGIRGSLSSKFTFNGSECKSCPDNCIFCEGVNQCSLCDKGY